MGYCVNFNAGSTVSLKHISIGIQQLPSKLKIKCKQLVEKDGGVECKLAL